MIKYILLTLLFFSPLFAFLEDKDEAQKAFFVQKEILHVKVSVIFPKATRMPIITRVRGIVEPLTKYTINAQVEGVLHNLVVDGEAVKKGTVIARLNNPPLDNKISFMTSRIELLENQLNIERKRLQSMKKMLDLGIVSEKEYLTQQSIIEEKMIALKLAQSDLKNLNLQKQREIVKTQIDGFISKLASEGSYIGIGGKVCDILSKKVRIRLFVPFWMSKNLKSGQYLYIELQDGKVKGRIKEILPKTSGNLVEVLADLEKTMPLGLNVEAKIVSRENIGWIIPKDSIVLVQNRPAVFVIKNNIAKLRFITVLKDMVNKALVKKDNFKPTDKIVLKNAYLLNDQMAVEVEDVH